MFFIHILTIVLYFAGKGDRAIQFVEVTEREPWFVEGLRYTGEQIKGSCLVPKRAMDVMQCEVGFYPDPTFYVDANPDPDPTVSYNFFLKCYQFILINADLHFVQNFEIFSEKLIHFRIRSGSAGPGFRCRSGSSKMMPIRPDPDPQHFFETTSLIAVNSTGCVGHLRIRRILNNTNPGTYGTGTTHNLLGTTCYTCLFFPAVVKQNIFGTFFISNVFMQCNDRMLYTMCVNSVWIGSEMIYCGSASYRPLRF
jgi:hypothetical protein